MTDQSRLDSAITAETEASGQWFRSPLVLVAGFILFLGALALLVLAITGGNDDVASTTTADSADSADFSSAAAPDDDAVRAAREPVAVEQAGIVFGGDEVLEVNNVSLAGDTLPLMADGDDPALGLIAPEVTATSLANGNPITLGPGRARVIGFFAHWCPHCQDELPEITAWLAENQLPPNTEFIAVSTVVDEGRGNYPPSAWFNEVGFSSPVLVDDADNSLLGGFGFTGFPAFVAIDASGTVVARAGGNIGTEGLEALFANFAS